MTITSGQQDPISRRLGENGGTFSGGVKLDSQPVISYEAYMTMHTSTPLNILWICTDSQRWDTLGCYGNSFVRTPNIDRLAAEGVRFEHCYSQSPLCTPSRGSFLTGRYPSTTRLRQNGQEVPEDLGKYLLPRLLRDQADYVCGLSGKLHLNNCNMRKKMGEDFWKYPKHYQLTPYEKRLDDDGYSVFHWAHGNHLNPYDAYSQWLYQKGEGLDVSFFEGKTLGPQVTEGVPAAFTHSAFCVDKAVEFIDLHHAKEMPHPWLFSINIVDPHPDFHPPKDVLDRYMEKLDEIPLPAVEEDQLAAKPSYQHNSYVKGEEKSQINMSDHDRRLIKAAYWATCDHIDDQVGLLLDALERTGQRESTLVVFTSDHGELLGDHGRTWKGAYLYDPCVRVPLIMSMPGTIPQGKVSSGMVELTDLAPTFLEAAGLPAARSMQGRSIWPALKGEADLNDLREDVYSEYYNANPGHRERWLNMLRTPTHKMIVCHGTGEGELYDLEADPQELNNLWEDDSCQTLKMDLLLRLSARISFTADPLPERLGIF